MFLDQSEKLFEFVAEVLAFLIAAGYG